MMLLGLLAALWWLPRMLVAMGCLFGGESRSSCFSEAYVLEAERLRLWNLRDFDVGIGET